MKLSILLDIRARIAKKSYPITVVSEFVNTINLLTCALQKRKMYIKLIMTRRLLCEFVVLFCCCASLIKLNIKAWKTLLSSVFHFPTCASCFKEAPHAILGSLCF